MSSWACLTFFKIFIEFKIIEKFASSRLVHSHNNCPTDRIQVPADGGLVLKLRLNLELLLPICSTYCNSYHDAK